MTFKHPRAINCLKLLAEEATFLQQLVDRKFPYNHDMEFIEDDLLKASQAFSSIYEKLKEPWFQPEK